MENRGFRRSFICLKLVLDNGRDHRTGTSDHPLQKHTHVRLRVHHIVIWRRELRSEVRQV